MKPVTVNIAQGNDIDQLAICRQIIPVAFARLAAGGLICSDVARKAIRS